MTPALGTSAEERRPCKQTEMARTASVVERAYQEPGAEKQPSRLPRKSVDPDAALVAQLRRADTGAAEALVGAYGDRVYRLAIRITGNASDAEEVAQDALWAASRKIDTFRGTSAFGSWVYRITANAAYQKLRKTGSQRHEVSWEDLVPSLDDFGQHAEVAIDWSRRLKDPAVEGELKRVLGRAIDELPARYRTAFLLHDVDGLSNPEIAQTLQVKLAAIKSRVHRARLFLRRRLAGYVGAPRCGDEAVTTAATQSHQYYMQIHVHACHVRSTRESDGLRRTSQEAGEARDRAGRAAQRDD
jgi:RNA polymerase sigma-70 factor (ECF subfamily)